MNRNLTYNIYKLIFKMNKRIEDIIIFPIFILELKQNVKSF